MVLNEISTREKAHEYIHRVLPLVNEINPPNDTLFSGDLARSMLNACLYEAWEEEIYLDKALDLLARVFDNFNQGVPRIFGPYYCNGLSGFAYALTSFVKKEYLDVETGEEINDLLAKIFPAVQSGFQNNYNDFLHGTFGYLHTLNHFCSWRGNTQLLITALRYMEQQTNLPASDWICSMVSDENDINKIDFGLAHGQSSLLMILMESYTLAGRNRVQDKNIRRKVDFVAAAKTAKISSDKKSYFPSWIDAVTGEKKTSARLAWCYSDLGPALMLYKAAEYFDNPEYREQANIVGFATTTRKELDVTGLNNPFVCHGTAGVAQIYRKLYELSGEADYQFAYEYWIRETFYWLEMELANDISIDKKRGFLDGLIGTTLSFLSYSTGKHLDWGKTILL